MFWWFEFFKDERVVFKDVKGESVVVLKVKDVGGDGDGGEFGEESCESDDDGLLFFEVNLNRKYVMSMYEYVDLDDSSEEEDFGFESIKCIYL